MSHVERGHSEPDISLATIAVTHAADDAKHSWVLIYERNGCVPCTSCQQDPHTKLMQQLADFHSRHQNICLTLDVFLFCWGVFSLRKVLKGAAVCQLIALDFLLDVLDYALLFVVAAAAATATLLLFSGGVLPQVDGTVCIFCR